MTMRNFIYFNKQQVTVSTVMATRKLNTLQRPVLNVRCSDGIVRKSYNGTVISHNALVIFSKPNVALITKRNISLLPTLSNILYPSMTNSKVKFNKHFTMIRLDYYEFYYNKSYFNDARQAILDNFIFPAKLRVMDSNGVSFALTVFKESHLDLALKQILLDYYNSEGLYVQIFIYNCIGDHQVNCYSPNYIEKPYFDVFKVNTINQRRQFSNYPNPQYDWKTWKDMISVRIEPFIQNDQIVNDISDFIDNNYGFPIKIGVDGVYSDYTVFYVNNTKEFKSLMENCIEVIYTSGNYIEEDYDQDEAEFRLILIGTRYSEEEFNDAVSVYSPVRTSKPRSKIGKREYSTQVSSVRSDSKLSKTGLYVDKRRGKVILNVDLGKLNVLQDFELFSSILVDNLNNSKDYGVILKIAYLDGNLSMYKMVGKQHHIRGLNQIDRTSSLKDYFDKINLTIEDQIEQYFQTEVQTGVLQFKCWELEAPEELKATTRSIDKSSISEDITMEKELEKIDSLVPINFGISNTLDPLQLRKEDEKMIITMANGEITIDNDRSFDDKTKFVLIKRKSIEYIIAVTRSDEDKILYTVYTSKGTKVTSVVDVYTKETILRS